MMYGPEARFSYLPIKVDNHLAMLFRNYFKKLSATDISAARSNAGMQAQAIIPFPQMRTTTRKKTQQIVEVLPSNGIADVSQTNGIVDALLRIILTKNLAATLVEFLSVWIMMARRRAMSDGIISIQAQHQLPPVAADADAHDNNTSECLYACATI